MSILRLIECRNENLDIAMLYRTELSDAITEWVVKKIKLIKKDAGPTDVVDIEA